MPDNPLSAGHALAARLYERGLAPPGCIEIDVYGTPRYRYQFQGGDWRPWQYIEHAWYLVEQFALSIESWPIREAPDGTVFPAGWNVYNGCDTGAFVATFTEVPTAICQAALKIQAGRNG